MAYVRKYAELLFSVILVIVAFHPIPEATGVSYPLNHKGLLPAGRKLGNLLSSSSPESPSSKKKKVLKVSKNLFQKLLSSQSEMEKDADRDVAETVFPVTHKVDQQLQKQIKNKPDNFFDTPRKFPESAMKSPLKTGHELVKSNNYYKPYYDCPLFNNANALGGAIIKPDPFDCGCCYYCNWGIHYVQCCSWPLLWNDDTKCCDWYWKVSCYSNNYWKE